MLRVQDCLGKIFQLDCMSFMQCLPAASIDLVIADGPYAVTRHSWDKVGGIQEYNLKLIQTISRILRPGGTLYLFGKQNCIDFIDYRKYLELDSRIIWYQPSRLSQGKRSYTNNYDIIAYFTKRPIDQDGPKQGRTFNLEEIRVPQLVELTHRKRAEKVPSVVNGRFFKTKFNPKGKNPGDVWGDIKQLTYKSKELVSRRVLNTIQKPEKLIKRLIKASSNPKDIIFDPFVGVGTSLKVAHELGRYCFGCEVDTKNSNTALNRLNKYKNKIEFELVTENEVTPAEFLLESGSAAPAVHGTSA